jgi:glycogen phosphorylase
MTGWAIGTNGDLNTSHEHATDATSLYDQLEGIILPMFYRERGRFIEVIRHAVALNGSFFNTQRMMQQDVLKAY